jgi:antirestriction protein ArdC
VESLTSGEDWGRYLAVASRFHRYSFLNTLAILVQRPDATRVAGYQRWRSLGRQVRRGEYGIRILAPLAYRVAADPDGSGTVEETTGERRVLRGFRVATVFDISQTDGDALPSPPVRVLDGDAPAALRADLVALIEAEGFGYSLGPLPGHPGALGVTDYDARHVTVRPDLAPAQHAKTTAHELAHVLLHGPGRTESRVMAEIEAESVAYVVCSAAGVDADAYSFGYVAAWSAGDLAAVRATGERVLACARQVLDRLGLDALGLDALSDRAA